MKFHKIALISIVIIVLLSFIYMLVSSELPAKMTLTIQEKAYINKINPVKLAVDPDWKPFEKISVEGQYSGIAADYIKLIEKRVGIDFRLVITEDWNQSIAYSQSGKVSALSLLNKTPERESWLVFTEPLIVDENVLVGRFDSPYISDLAKLIDKTLVLPEGTAVEKKVRKDFPNLKIILVKGEQACFKMVSEGGADYTLRSLLVSEYNIRGNGWFNLKIVGEVDGYTNYLCIGLNKDYAALKPILDRAILSITEQERTDILNRNVPLKVEMENTQKSVLTLLVITTIGAFVMLLSAFIQSYRANYFEKNNRKIQEITKRYEALSELSGTFFWQMDTRGSYTYISPEVLKVLGFEPEGMIGKNYRDFIEPSKQVTLLDTLANMSIIKNYEVRHQSGSQGYLWLKIDAMPVRDQNMNIVGYSGSSTDIEIKKQLELKLIEAKNEVELAYYQAQITPHFLYNAMSAIALYCSTEPEKASQLVMDLSYFLRTRFDFKQIDSLITISEELELIRAYINIEVVRYQERLNIDFDVESDLLNQLAPPLIMQPIIENAINHGIMKKVEGGHIYIKAKRTDQCCHIEIADDGIGIEQSLIEEIANLETNFNAKTIDAKMTFSRNGIGLVNIQERLLRSYGQGLKIKRNEMGGTTVSYCLPYHIKDVKQ